MSRVFFTLGSVGMRGDEFGDARGAHDAGFNELFYSPLVPLLNHRFNQCFSNRINPALFLRPFTSDQYTQPFKTIFFPSILYFISFLHPNFTSHILHYKIYFASYFFAFILCLIYFTFAIIDFIPPPSPPRVF